MCGVCAIVGSSPTHPPCEALCLAVANRERTMDNDKTEDLALAVLDAMVLAVYRVARPSDEESDAFCDKVEDVRSIIAAYITASAVDAVGCDDVRTAMENLVMSKFPV